MLILTTGVYQNNSFAQESDLCEGILATVIGIEGERWVNGTTGNDVIIGQATNGIIVGKAGDDIICGGELASPNVINAGVGIDTCYATLETRVINCENIIYIDIDVDITQDMVITISTDKLIYNLGEPIVISGTIDPILENIPVVVEIINSNDETVERFQFDIVRLDGTFGATTDEGERIPAGDYTVSAVDARGETDESTFTITSDPFVRMTVSDKTPAIGEEFSVSGNASGVEDASQKSVLIEIISPNVVSLTEARNTAHTSAFIPTLGGAYSVDIDLALDDFFKQSGDFTVQAFIVLNSDIESLPPNDIPKGNVLALDTIKILDFETRTGNLDVAAPVLRIDQGITLPDSTAADTSNIDHILRVSVTNNQDLLLPETTTTITIVTPDNPSGEVFTRVNSPRDVGSILQMDARFVPSTPGDYIFTFELKDALDSAVITPVNHTVTVGGTTTNPEKTNQELSDENVLLEARVTELERLVAQLLAALS